MHFLNPLESKIWHLLVTSSKQEREGGNGLIAGNKNTSEFFLWIPSCQIHTVSDSDFSL